MSEENIDCIVFSSETYNSLDDPCLTGVYRKSFSLCGDLSAVSAALERHAFLNSNMQFMDSE